LGQFRLDRKPTPGLVPGYPAARTFYQRVAEFGDHVRMPMRGKLSPEEIRTIQRRIEKGAIGPSSADPGRRTTKQLQAFVPLVKPSLPTGSAPNPIVLYSAVTIAEGGAAGSRLKPKWRWIWSTRAGRCRPGRTGTGGPYDSHPEEYFARAEEGAGRLGRERSHGVGGCDRLCRYGGSYVPKRPDHRCEAPGQSGSSARQHRSCAGRAWARRKGCGAKVANA